MIDVLVTGGNGQLARCIEDLSERNSALNFRFASKKELPIDNMQAVREFFEEHTFDFVINTAAYTNVDLAEKEKEKAFSINADGAINIAKECERMGCVLIHISTDYVFDGTAQEPYTEDSVTNPINCYGASKLEGENGVKQYCKAHYIIRTSWLYSMYGKNFLKTILSYAEAGKDLSITTEQKGCPTNANDLAMAILQIIESKMEEYGIYHYSNSGIATWYDFAIAILTYSNQLTETNIVKTDHYRTFAKRPTYSVLNTNKFTSTFQTNTIAWKESLKSLITSAQIL